MIVSYAQRIEQKLTERLTPTHLEVRDDSESHRGHSGYQEGGETHFHVTVVSETFAGLSRVARQRLVYETLALELEEHVHALSLTTKTPEEPLP